MKSWLKLDEELVNDFGTGVLEDLFPYLKDIFPTAKWKKVMGKVNAVLTKLRAKFKEHVDSFEPG